MANKKSNVSTGKPKPAGAVFRAPAGTAVPTDATTELDQAFKSMGFVSEEGVTSAKKFDSETIRDWGGDPVYETEDNVEDTLKMTLIESINPEVLKAVHNEANVSGTLETGITVKVNGEEHENAVWVVDMILRGGVLKRVVIPDAKITEVGEIVYRRNEVTGYQITLKANADASGQYHYEYIKAPANNG